MVKWTAILFLDALLFILLFFISFGPNMSYEFELHFFLIK